MYRGRGPFTNSLLEKCTVRQTSIAIKEDHDRLKATENNSSILNFTAPYRQLVGGYVPYSILFSFNILCNITFHIVLGIKHRRRSLY